MVAGPGCDPGISGFNSRTTLASVAEWFIAAACKAAVLTGIGGSNPSRRTLRAADSAAVFPKEGCPVRLRVEVLVSRRAKSTWPYRVPSVTFKETRRPTTLAYLAGLLEGEGSFLRPPPSSPQQSAVALAMTDEDVVSRAAMLLETSRQAPPYRRAVHHKPVYTARVRGLRAVEVMQALYPMMGARRQRQIGQMEGTFGQRRRQQVQAMRATLADRRSRNGVRESAAGNRRGFVPPSRMARNLEIAGRLAAGETGPALAAEYGMTHQNIYFIGNKYKT